MLQLSLSICLIVSVFSSSLDYPDLYETVTWNPHRIKTHLYHNDPLRSMRRLKVSKFRRKDLGEDFIIPFHPISSPSSFKEDNEPEEEVIEEYPDQSEDQSIDRSFNAQRRSISQPTQKRSFKSWHELREQINQKQGGHDGVGIGYVETEVKEPPKSNVWGNFDLNPTSFHNMTFSHLGDFIQEHEKNFANIQNNFVFSQAFDQPVQEEQEDFESEWGQDVGSVQGSEIQHSWPSEPPQNNNYWNTFDASFDSERDVPSSAPTTSTTQPTTKKSTRSYQFTSQRPKRHFGGHYRQRSTTTIIPEPYIPSRKPEATRVFGLRNAFINDKTTLTKVLPKVRTTTSDDELSHSSSFPSYVTPRIPYRNNFGLRTVTKSHYRPYKQSSTRSRYRSTPRTSPTTRQPTTTITTTLYTTTTTTTTTTTQTSTTTRRPRSIVTNFYSPSPSYSYTEHSAPSWSQPQGSFVTAEIQPTPEDIVVFRSQPSRTPTHFQNHQSQQIHNSYEEPTPHRPSQEVIFRQVPTRPPVPNIAAPSTLEYIPLYNHQQHQLSIPQPSQKPLKNEFISRPFIHEGYHHSSHGIHFTTRVIILPQSTTTVVTTTTTTARPITTPASLPNPPSLTSWLVQPQFDTFTAPRPDPFIQESGRRPPRKISDLPSEFESFPYPSSGSPSVVGVLEVLNDNRLSTFASLLEKFNIIDTFRLNQRPSTIFAPSNAAFGDINLHTLGEFQLMKIIKSHIVYGRIPEKKIANDRTGNSMVNTTLRTNIFKTDDQNWKEIEVKTVNGALITKFDIPIPSSGGIIHVIDRVISSPSDKSVLQVLQEDPGQRFTTFLKALQVIKFDSVLGTGEGPWTVFAPTNKAFRTLDARSMDTILRDSKKLSKLLFGHIIQKTIYSVGVKQHEMLSMSNGHNLNIFSRGDRMKFEGGNVIQMDISGTNGVVQVVDQVVRKI